MEVDHLFICVDGNGQEADALTNFGLVEGSSNTHPGQGTANRRFFFQNTFIEFLYLHNALEAQSHLSAPTRLFDRLTSTDGIASPFGVCFRPSGVESKPGFASWEYRPAYLPAGLKVYVGSAPISEPMWFFLSFAKRPDQLPIERAQPLEHPQGLREITSVRIMTPEVENFSTTAICANQMEGFEICYGAEHMLILGFDGEVSGQTYDFRPGLPMIMNW